MVLAVGVTASALAGCTGAKSHATAVTTPGVDSILPTVPTPPRAIALSRISSAACAAAASESWRSRMGVEPACAAWPVKTIRCRSTPNVPETAAASRCESSNTGPCSMWSST